MASEESLVKLYLAIGETERHFNTIQSNYRLLASTWTLACLGGIGFVLTSQAITITLERPLICLLIALSGSVSILILWLVDIRVYQRLLSMFYNEGLVMEAVLPWLSQVRHETRRTFKGSLARAISLYYVSMFAFLCIIAIMFSALSNGIDLGYHPISIGPVSIGHIGVAPWRCATIVAMYCVLTCCWLLWRVRPEIHLKDDNYEKRIEEYASAIAVARARSASDQRSRLRARGMRID